MGHWTPWIKLHHITEILHLLQPKALWMCLHVKGAFVCLCVCLRVCTVCMFVL